MKTTFTFSIFKRLVGGDLEVATGLELGTLLITCCHLSNEPFDTYFIRNEQTLEDVTIIDIDEDGNHVQHEIPMFSLFSSPKNGENEKTEYSPAYRWQEAVDLKMKEELAHPDQDFYIEQV